MASKYSLSIFVLCLLAIIFLYLDVQLYKNIQLESRFNVKITVKAAMLDHVNTYLLQPLSALLVEVTNFPALYPGLSANHISYCGVLVAFIAARLAVSEKLYVRRISVFVFLIRQFLDDLDGFVARFHMGIDAKKQVSLPNTSGYLVDGICDGIGFVVYWFAVFLHTHNRQHVNKNSNVFLFDFNLPLYQPQATTNKRRRLIKYYLLVLLQMALSSLFWNLFLIKYHRLLDPALNHGFEMRTPLQDEIFKSSLMFMIMWLWRCMNPHALTTYFLCAVWLNQPTHYAKRSSHYFFWIVFGTSFLCEVHLQDIKYQLDMSY